MAYNSPSDVSPLAPTAPEADVPLTERMVGSRLAQRRLGEQGEIVRNGFLQGAQTGFSVYVISSLLRGR